MPLQKLHAAIFRLGFLPNPLGLALSTHPDVFFNRITDCLVQISAQDFSRNPRVKQYVYLVAVFQNGPRLEKVVIVSFQAGYIFIETDKTLYTPGSYGERSKMLSGRPGYKTPIALEA